MIWGVFGTTSMIVEATAVTWHMYGRGCFTPHPGREVELEVLPSKPPGFGGEASKRTGWTVLYEERDKNRRALIRSILFPQLFSQPDRLATLHKNHFLWKWTSWVNKVSRRFGIPANSQLDDCIGPSWGVYTS